MNETVISQTVSCLCISHKSKFYDPTLSRIKGALPGLIQFLITESYFKMMKKAP